MNMSLKVALITSFAILLPILANARVKGEMECHYQIVSKQSWPNAVYTEAFTADITKSTIMSTSSEVLTRSIHMRYNPGYTNNKISHLVFSLTYGTAHGGADIPITEGEVTLKIGNSSSDLIGGFLTCNVVLN